MGSIESKTSIYLEVLFFRLSLKPFKGDDFIVFGREPVPHFWSVETNIE